MKWLYNMKIGKKLISSFVLVALLAGVVGFVGLWNIKNIDRDYSALYTDYGIPTGEIGEVGMMFNDTRAKIRDVLISSDDQEIDEYVQKMADLDKQILAGLDKFEGEVQTEEMRTVFNELKENLDAYSILRDQVVQMVRSGQKEAATERFYKEGTPIISAVATGIDRLFEEKRTTGAQLSDALTAQSSRTVNSMLAIVGITIAVAVLLGITISRMISKPVTQLMTAAEKIANGDLDVEIVNEHRDEVGVLALSFRKMTDNLNEVMTHIQAASEQVASGSKQVSDVSIALSQGATEQASSIEQLSASIEEIASQTKLNADNAALASQLAEQTRNNATMGSEQMNEMLKAMDGINTASESISRIIKVIDEIAFQTNILALNAAVEAARAGQHGKGFAVVAEEVRNLAARSANAAKETTGMIENSVRKVEGGTKIANDTAAALKAIVCDVEKVANLVGDIATASGEQSAGVNQINQGILQVSQVIQANSATSEEGAAASEELSSQADLLREQVERFNLRKGNLPKALRGTDEIHPDVLRMLGQMAENNRASQEGSKDAPGHPASPRGGRIVLSDREFGKY
ncbi:methyl-accepting chemotaxis protein [Paenibacillus timonensis]|uniref:Methyl-accepting chemotaxis protein n=2 Tax=Paenibacillus timonensis TaxID=225915 RepID=A0ABW3S9U5_9BACL|nr:methyl-accepting chemotaxis protein [Paenibacillus timonensis]